MSNEHEPIRISIEETKVLKAMEYFEKALNPEIVYNGNQLDMAHSAIEVMKGYILQGMRELYTGHRDLEAEKALNGIR